MERDTATNIEGAILTIRGQRVILDQDLARLYGTSTKRLNEQVKRNRERFPEDFMFQLEVQEVGRVARGSYLPPALTEPYLWFSHTALRARYVCLHRRHSSPAVLLPKSYKRKLHLYNRFGLNLLPAFRQ
jgi:hypothetical protein